MAFFKDIGYPTELYQNGKLNQEIIDFLEFSLVLVDPFVTVPRVSASEPKTVPVMIPVAPVPTQAPVIYVDKSTVIHSADSKERVGKSPVKRVIDGKESKVSQVEAKKESEEETEKKSEKESKLLLGLAAVAAGSVALASTYFFAQRHGEIDFINQFELLKKQVKESISSIRLWIRERQSLDLSVPRIVIEDVDRLTELIDVIERLDNKNEKIQSRRSYGIISISSVCLCSGFLSTQTKLRWIGFVGLGVTLIERLYHQGLYSSPSHKNSQKLLASRGKRIAESIKNDHISRLRMLLDF